MMMMMIRVGNCWVTKTMAMMITMAKKITMDLNNHQSSVGLYNDVNDDKEVEKETISKVGVDPLMRQRVWEHILQVVSLGSLGSKG